MPLLIGVKIVKHSKLKTNEGQQEHTRKSACRPLFVLRFDCFTMEYQLTQKSALRCQEEAIAVMTKDDVRSPSLISL